MIKLLCINNKQVSHTNGTSSSAIGLIEGEIYSAEDATYIHPDNKKECYFILELNDLKLASRFVPLSGLNETEPITPKVESDALTEVAPSQSFKQRFLSSIKQVTGY